LTFISGAFAHPLGDFIVNQSTGLQIRRERVHQNPSFGY
jgi:hypothetical protein